jgi:hypothetical protein
MQRSLLALLFVPCLLAVGCNSLTEPNEFRVQKEKPQAAAPKQAADGEQKPGSVVEAAPNAPAPNAPANVEKMPVKAPAPAQAPHAHAPGGSCGE